MRSWSSNRERLQNATIRVPSSLIFPSILDESLATAGFGPRLQTFFSWLGVVPCVSDNAIWSALEFIAGLPGGAYVVFDCSDSPEKLSTETRARPACSAGGSKGRSVGDSFLKRTS